MDAAYDAIGSVVQLKAMGEYSNNEVAVVDLKRVGLVLASLGIFSANNLAAEEHQYFQAKSTIGFGAAYQTAQAELRASAGNLPEVAVDLDDLGMDRDDWSWAMEGRWRYSPKWMLVGLAYTFGQDGSRSVEKDFNFDGKQFTAGGAVDTDLKVNTYIIDLMYSVYRSRNSEILVGGGIHAIDLDASISGRVSVAGIKRQRSTGSSEILAPLPNFRAQAFHALTDNWGASVSMGWLSAKYDDYDGSFVYVHPRIGYAFDNGWAITGGYQYVDIELIHEKSRQRENEFNVDFKGPTVFLNYRF
jgi:Outer membrane protein beta-barrel domain